MNELPPDPIDVTGPAGPADAPLSNPIDVDTAAVAADTAADAGPAAVAADTAADAGPAAVAWLEEGQAPEPLRAVRRQNTIAIIGTVMLAVVLAFGGGFAVGRATGPSASPEAAASSAPASSEEIAEASASAGPSVAESGPYLGSPDAKTVIEYWADYQCPYCARFALDVLPQLQSRLENGTVAIRHLDFAFIGPESVSAAIAVRCAGDEGLYWPMHDAVYGAQNGENKGAFAEANLVAIAARIMPDTARLQACLADHTKLVEVLDDTAAGVRAGIQSTPTIDVNGQRFLGVPDISRFLAAIDAAASGASPAPLPTAAPSSEPWTGTSTAGREAGNPAAPVTVDLWMDYQSPDNAVLANTLEPELRTRIADGTVHLVLHDLALGGTESVNAGTMVRCIADQEGPALFVHDILSVSAQGKNAGIFVTDNFLRLASKLGVEVKTLDTCLANPSMAKRVTEETSIGKSKGMTAGPVVVVSAAGKEIARFTGSIDTAQVTAAIDGRK